MQMGNGTPCGSESVSGDRSAERLSRGRAPAAMQPFGQLRSTRATTPLPASMRITPPRAVDPSMQHWQRELRTPDLTVHTAMRSYRVPTTEPQFPHDLGRAVTPSQSGYSFGQGFGRPHSNTHGSLWGSSMGSTSLSAANRPRGEVSPRRNRPVSNFANTIVRGISNAEPDLGFVAPPACAWCRAA